jgi:hypothetical protein
MIGDGEDIATVTELLGHSVETARRYVSLSATSVDVARDGHLWRNRAACLVR